MVQFISPLQGNALMPSVLCVEEQLSPCTIAVASVCKTRSAKFFDCRHQTWGEKRFGMQNRFQTCSLTSCPHVSQGALTDLFLFSPDQIKYCSMHSLNLGIALWAAGGCLKLLMEWGTWGADDVFTAKQQFTRAWMDFNRYTKQNKIPSWAWS